MRRRSHAACLWRLLCREVAYYWRRPHRTARHRRSVEEEVIRLQRELRRADDLDARRAYARGLHRR